MRAAVGRLLADEHPEQRRLARAVGPDDAHDPGPRQRERQVLDQQPVAVALAQVLDLDDRVAQPRTRRDGDLELPCTPLVVLRLGQQLLVGAEAGLALRLPRPRRQADPRELARQGPRAGVRGLVLERHARELLLQPAGVVARERDAAAAVQLQDPLRHVVQEVAVVGDRDDGPAVLAEEPLQPLDRLGVEMVRRLVEQEQVRVLEQQPAERHAALLAAREPGHLGVVRRTAQGVHRDVDVAFQVPRVGGRDPVLEDGLLGADGLVVGVRVGPARHHGVVLLDEAGDRADAVHHVALDVLGRIQLRLLGEVAHGEAGRQAGLAGEPVVEPGHDPQQAGLAGAVGADDADLGARVERDRDVLEHGPVGRIVAGELVRGVDELGRHDRSRVPTRTDWPCPDRAPRPACP